METIDVFRIAELIAKYMRDELTAGEREELEFWKTSAAENERLLGEFTRYEFLESKQIAERLCGKDKAWQQFCRRRQAYLSRRRHRIVWSCVAAALAIFIGVGAMFWLMPQEPAGQSPVEQVLAAGESRAILTLADGRQISLGKETNDTLIQEAEITVNASRKCITYTPSKENRMQLLYNQLDIPRKGEYMLLLADGTKVWLNSESQLKYPVAFQGNQRRVLLKGEAYFEVQRDEKRPFVVETTTSEIEVLGTSFNIRAYADEALSYTTLVEGCVQLSCGEKSMVLSPNEQGIVDPVSGRIDKRTVDVLLYTSWKEGRFVFENQTLEEIMQTLSRWYDLKVFFTSEEVKQARFIGNLQRYDNFNQIVEMLEMTGVAHFLITGDTIRVSE